MNLRDRAEHVRRGRFGDVHIEQCRTSNHSRTNNGAGQAAAMQFDRFEDSRIADTSCAD
ncbi:hypothetical protein [Synechococcus sp. BIOS-E4-1]|uniref:hypothetical protein n=1 Tax=Synechococcus sp. BIOS-E4-1 TaxID=1400864 RepID=UPI0016470623|nr:hypothetical protein [Synechococcus sp. BIOS-E4-1]